LSPALCYNEDYAAPCYDWQVPRAAAFSAIQTSLHPWNVTMAYLGNSVEYALHSLLWLAAPLEQRPSARDLAALQGISPAFLSKIFQKLEKGGIVEASGGIRGGYRLAKPADDISVLEIIDAVEGRKNLFDCQEIRGRCVLFKGKPPAWATRGVCGIHALMLRAEKTLRDELGRSSLGSLSAGFRNKRLPSQFSGAVQDWFAARQTDREDARLSAMRSGRSSAR
jgi:Rrf2 family protein